LIYIDAAVKIAEKEAILKVRGDDPYTTLL